MNDFSTGDSKRDIAIIGMSGRFPKSEDLDKFWQNLQEGVDCISFFLDEELLSSGVAPESMQNPDYIKAKAVIEDVDLFDASFFGINPGDAEKIDPQQRLFLEYSWSALENAGYNPENYEGLIGVFAGSTISSYLLTNLLPNRGLLNQATVFQTIIGNDKDYLTTRVSYHLNLKGPSITIQTACSTSLVAIACACQNLLSYQCDIALAGGVSITFPHKAGYIYQEGMISSPDGCCRAFDAKARGTVWGEGVGIVVMKRLAEALADGDKVHAVIKGCAINNDGSLKVGYTAPSVDGQAEVIALAQAIAGVEPETIGYVETHGTGTPIGDPIEVAALTKAFRAGSERKGICAIGSLKTNIGHTDAAAGVAGLIKTVLALEHKLLPPSLHFEEPNPEIDFSNSPFYVNTELSYWKAGGSPRRAGVSSFGIGGTNAHVVVEEAPALEPSSPSRPWQLLVLSAKTESALNSATRNLAEHFKKNERLSLADIAYTLQVGRRRFNNRRFVVCQNLDDAISAIDALDPKRVFSTVEEAKDRPVVFMFSGQGSQYVNMGRELYQLEPLFREQVDLCAGILKSHLGCDIRDVIYPDENTIAEAACQLEQTAFTQPALFVIEYALAKLLEDWGIRPQTMIGHSIGEYVAACVAGVFSLDEALSLVAKRGQLIQSLPAGAMLAVALTEKEVHPLLGEKLSLAAVNSTSMCVISGPEDDVGTLEKGLFEKGVSCIKLHTSHAFHSQMMEPVLTLFLDHVRRVNLKSPKMRYVSNVTGKWITAEQAMDPAYWVSHLRQTVRFADGVAELLEGEDAILLEVGPGRTLAGLVQQHANKTASQVVLSSLRHPKEQESDSAFLQKMLGRLWLAGANIDWIGFYRNQRRRRVTLPTYPFERQRYWVEPIRQPDSKGVREASLSKKLDIADWFYVPSWKRTILPRVSEKRAPAEQERSWLLFVDKCDLGETLVKRLKESGRVMIKVMAGSEFRCLGEDTYTINPQLRSDYGSLISELRGINRLPSRIVHFWSITSENPQPSGIDFFYQISELGFYSLLFIAQALEEHGGTGPFQIDVVTNGLFDVTGEEGLCPEKSTILGPCKVIPQEYPNIGCRCIDVAFPAPGDRQQEQMPDQLLAELAANSSSTTIAYRGQHRWVQSYEPIQLDEGDAEIPVALKERGVYLIIGGLGRMGYALSKYLAKTVRAKLILTACSAFPDRKEWKQWLETHDGQDRVSRKIQKALSLEILGAEVVVVNADIANFEQMRAVVDFAHKRFGQLHGVIHAAGIVGNKSSHEIRNAEKALSEQVFRAKVNGLLTLERVLQTEKLDFCLLTSSMSSIMGGLGLASLSAADLFMDAFANKRRRMNSVPWTSVNWDGLQLGEDSQLNAALKAKFDEFAIAPDEAAVVLNRILSMVSMPQVAVSTVDLPTRLGLWIDQKNIGNSELSIKREQIPQHARPDVATAYGAPRNELEKEIAEIWQELLGIKQVGIFDNYFELGGNSLSASQAVYRMKEKLKVEIPLKRFFEGASVAALSEFIEATQWAKQSQFKSSKSKQAGYEEI